MKSDRFWGCPECGCVNITLEDATDEKLQMCGECEEMFFPSDHEATWEQFSVWCRGLK
jgi:hypothetical protein